jgi:Phage terminase-like protein, large subunit
MPGRDYAGIARQYARAVLAGGIPACRWVRAACQRQIDDLACFKGRSSPYRFNPVLTDACGLRYRPADRACAFVEQLCHVKGPLAGQPIQLEPWQAFILATVFGWVKADGKRRFRRSYIEVPRGNAKSTLSSAVGLYMLAADNEGGAEVYSLATTRDQARIVLAMPRPWFGVIVLCAGLLASRSMPTISASRGLAPSSRPCPPRARPWTG